MSHRKNPEAWQGWRMSLRKNPEVWQGGRLSSRKNPEVWQEGNADSDIPPVFFRYTSFRPCHTALKFRLGRRRATTPPDISGTAIPAPATLPAFLAIPRS